MTAIPDREAFRVAKLQEAVGQARAAFERSRTAFGTAKGPAKANARRELRRAQSVLSRAEKALQAEQAGEEAAPAVQRQTIMQGDVVLREARIVTHGRSPSLVCSLDRMKNRGVLTAEEHAAGRAYRTAWEAAHVNAYPIGLGEALGGGSPSSGNPRIENAVGSSMALQRLRAMLSRQEVSLVEHVAVLDLDSESWGVERALNRHHVIGYLKAVLGRLAERG